MSSTTGLLPESILSPSYVGAKSSKNFQIDGVSREREVFGMETIKGEVVYLLFRDGDKISNTPFTNFNVTSQRKVKNLVKRLKNNRKETSITKGNFNLTCNYKMVNESTE